MWHFKQTNITQFLKRKLSRRSKHDVSDESERMASSDWRRLIDLACRESESEPKVPSEWRQIGDRLASLKAADPRPWQARCSKSRPYRDRLLTLVYVIFIIKKNQKKKGNEKGQQRIWC
ncbi:unnamed protein product, partial [Brenthis ino]